MSTYVCVDGHLLAAALVECDGLTGTSERHRLEIAMPRWTPIPDVESALVRWPEAAGVVFTLDQGWVGRRHLREASRLLERNVRCWFYWPREQAVEVVDQDRLESYRHLWLAVQAGKVARRVRRALGHGSSRAGVAAAVASGVAPGALADDHGRQVATLAAAAAPVRWPDAPFVPGARVAGTGVYLRLDFWARITSGGSYGHTCFVAKELAARTERFVAFMAHRYGMLDELGLRQVVLDRPTESQNEEDLIAANAPFVERLSAAIDAIRPAYIYERLCLGSYVGALLSHRHGVPYIVEYNGSEISMRRSFEGRGYRHEALFRSAEDAAFRQATLITVVSSVIKDDLVRRGCDPAKILVNPNGADAESYAPPDAAARASIRREFGWTDEHVVVGFTGTFGGWHGIDVLSAALPSICAANPRIRVLLIGDGNLKPMVDEAVRTHGIAASVRSVGRVPQEEGRRLLGACDVFVSPHSSHMIDSRFFGSPTKLFEYMAMGRGIVASELEQLGDVLSPGLTAEAVRDPAVAVSDERAVLVPAGDVPRFVEGVLALAERPEIGRALGRNARQAVLDYFAWSHHVERTLQAASGAAPVDALDYRPAIHRATPAEPSQPAPGASTAPALATIATGDPYKDEVQRQWNRDPAGSHYVKEAEPHTLEWFLEVEAHRYGEYAPWMPETMEFALHGGKDVLEIGGGMGTDLAQFARHGARVTDLDLSAGHLALAEENFRLRGLEGRFVHHDAEGLPFPDASFDLVYSNGVIHHTPHTHAVVAEMRRVLRPGGRVIAMVYARRSLHYWGVQVGWYGIRENRLEDQSIGDIMSDGVERSVHGSRPLVKVYSRRKLRELFGGFADVSIVQRQLTRPELRGPLRPLPPRLVERLLGWNLVVKGTKPR